MVASLCLLHNLEKYDNSIFTTLKNQIDQKKMPNLTKYEPQLKLRKKKKKPSDTTLVFGKKSHL